MSGWPFGDYPEGGLERLGPHVTAFYSDTMPLSNSAIVRGTGATLVFDSNVGGFADRLLDAVNVGGPPLAHLVLSHVHEDHTLGAGRFVPPARALARRYTCDKLAERATGPSRTGRSEPPGDVVVPDEVVEEERSLDLGGGVVVQLRPFPGAAHTRGDLWAFVEPDGVGLSGDLWFNACEPYFGSGSVTGAVAAVRSLRDAGAGIYLPGHGRAGVISREDPIERFGRWLLEQVEALPGLGGEALAAEVRRRYEASDDVSFPYSVSGFLERNVEAAARDVRRG